MSGVVRKISTRMAIDGEAEYRSAISGINFELKTLSSELKLVESNFKGQANTTAALTAKGTALQNSLNKQKQKTNELKSALDNAKKAQATYSTSIEQAKSKIAATEAALEKLKSSTGDTTAEEKKLTAELAKQRSDLANAEAGYKAATAGVNDWQRQVNDSKVALNDLDGELKKNDKYLDEAKRSTDGCAKSIDKFGNETEQAEKKTSKFNEIFKGAFWAGLATRAISAVTQKIKEFTRSAIEAGDRIGTMSEKIGLSTDRLQELEYAGTRLDVSVDTVTGSMTKLVRNMNTARAGSKLQIEAFNKLGIEITKADGSLRDANTVFGEAIDALGKVHNETERDAIAMQLFGKSAQDLNPLISAGSEELERLSEEAHEAGAVMSEETVEALDNFDETIEQAKLSAKAFIGEALAGIIGDGKTAAETMTDLQESLSKTDNTQKLIDKYRRLSEELLSGALSAEEVKSKTTELEQAKQDLIKASGGVVTAFDIENGTFDQQVGVLENATQAEKDYLKHKLMAEIIENSGEGAKRKHEKALKDYTDATKQHERALDDQAKAQEKVNAGILPEKALKAREANVEGWEETKLAALNALNATEEGAVEAESALQSLIDSGMTVSDVAEETGLSVDELNAILSSTGDTAENTIPEIEEFKESISGLETEYEAAYESALSSLQSQYDLWEKAPEVVETSLAKMGENLDSNTEFFNNYADNLETAFAFEIPGVDMQPLYDSISDGTPEAMGRAQELADAIASGNTDAIISLATKAEAAEAAEKRVAVALGEEKVDFDTNLDEIKKRLDTAVDDMDMSIEATNAARSTMQSYVSELKAKEGPAVAAAQKIAAAVSAALNNTSSGKIEHNAKGTDNSADMFIAGENGPELIVGRGGSKVWTAEQTASILARANSIASQASFGQTINHTGTIRVEGINNQGEFISATEIVLEDLRRGARL